MNVDGYMYMFWIHEFDDDKCDVVLSCCVLVTFEKMGQKGEVRFWWIWVD